MDDAKPQPTLKADKEAIPVGGKVILTCNVAESSGWKYYWYRNKKDSNPLTAPNGVPYSDSQISISEGGQYWCRGWRGDSVYYTEYTSITIHNAPRAVVSLQPNWPHIYKGESITLICEIQDGGDTEWEYEWEKNSRPHRTQKEFNIIGTYTSQTGEYRCKGRHRSGQRSSTEWSDPVSLTVSYKPEPKLTVSPSWLSPGASVTLNCSVEYPSAGWRFYWYKAVPQLSSSSYTYELLPDREAGTAEGSYVIHGPTHTAGFMCQVGRGDPVFYTKNSTTKFVWSGDRRPSASVTVSSNRTQHFRRKYVTLTCAGNSSHWKMKRFFEEKVEQPWCSSSWMSMHESTCSIFTSHTSAVYWCEFDSGEFSNAVNITSHDKNVVLESPVYPVTEGDSVTFRCINRNKKLISIADFYQNGKLIKNKTKGEMTLHAVSKSDEGFYMCKGSGSQSACSWMAVNPAASNLEKPSIPNTSHRVLWLVRLVIGLVLVIVLLLLCYYRKIKGPSCGRSFHPRSSTAAQREQQKRHSPVEQGDTHVYEYVGGSEDTENGGPAGQSGDVTFSVIALKNLHKSEKPADPEESSVRSDARRGSTAGTAPDVPKTVTGARGWMAVIRRGEEEAKAQGSEPESGGRLEGRDWGRGNQSDSGNWGRDRDSQSGTGNWYGNRDWCRGSRSGSGNWDRSSQTRRAAGAGSWDCRADGAGSWDCQEAGAGVGVAASLQVADTPEKCTRRSSRSPGCNHRPDRGGDLRDLLSSLCIGNVQESLLNTKMGHTLACVLVLLLQSTLLHCGHAAGPVLTLEPNRFQVFAGESVTFVCDAGEEENADLQYKFTVNDGHDIFSWSTYNRRTLSYVETSRSGEYHCELFPSYKKSNKVSLTVSEKPKAKLTSDKGEIPESGTVTLTCSVEVSDGWKYNWYRTVTDRIEEVVEGGASLHYRSVRVSQGGLYWCKGGRGDPVYYTHSSDPVSLDKIVSTRPVVTQQPNWPHIFSGESVTLTCEIHGGGDTQWEYEWSTSSSYRPLNQAVQRIHSAYSYMSGNYSCKGRNMRDKYSSTESSHIVRLTVLMHFPPDTPKPKLTVSPSWLSPGASVTLNCSVEYPSAGWRFYWYKAVPQLSSSFYTYELLPDREAGTAEGSYVIHELTHTAGFMCKVGRGDPVFYTKNSTTKFVWSGDRLLSASVKVSPNRTQHFGSAELSCEGNSSKWQVKRFAVEEPRTACSLLLKRSTCNINSQTSVLAVYWCESGSGEFSNAVNITLRNSGLILMSPVHPVTEGDSVTLGCKYDAGIFVYRVDFYQNGKLIKNNTKGEMTIRAVSKSDEGFYMCKYSRIESPPSWMAVNPAVSNLEKPSIFNPSHHLVWLIGLVTALLLVFLLLLLCYYRKIKGPCCGRSFHPRSSTAAQKEQQERHSPVEQGDTHVYEYVGGSEDTENGGPAGQSGDITYSVIALKKVHKSGKPADPEESSGRSDARRGSTADESGVTYAEVCFKNKCKAEKEKGLPATVEPEDMVYSEVKPGASHGS
ncbi:uncharacterized protein LOC115376226 [Myripristis murdjan]|uniref:uncharacterized protein LOC115376226 n=1 Tax=Myripristis murdjan TaxID=586833 RepID=UPI001175F0A8|nr:uncharacterized protein LOC115376226 [Myripristis murdjan]